MISKSENTTDKMFRQTTIDRYRVPASDIQHNL